MDIVIVPSCETAKTYINAYTSPCRPKVAECRGLQPPEKTHEQQSRACRESRQLAQPEMVKLGEAAALRVVAHRGSQPWPQISDPWNAEPKLRRQSKCFKDESLLDVKLPLAMILPNKNQRFKARRTRVTRVRQRPDARVVACGKGPPWSMALKAFPSGASVVTKSDAKPWAYRTPRKEWCTAGVWSPFTKQIARNDRENDPINVLVPKGISCHNLC